MIMLYKHNIVMNSLESYFIVGILFYHCGLINLIFSMAVNNFYLKLL